MVYPRIQEMKYAALQTKYDVGPMMSPYSIVKDTSMAVGLREYVPEIVFHGFIGNRLHEHKPYSLRNLRIDNHLN